MSQKELITTSQEEVKKSDSLVKSAKDSNSEDKWGLEDPKSRERPEGQQRNGSAIASNDKIEKDSEDPSEKSGTGENQPSNQDKSE